MSHRCQNTIRPFAERYFLLIPIISALLFFAQLPVDKWRIACIKGWAYNNGNLSNCFNDNIISMKKLFRNPMLYVDLGLFAVVMLVIAVVNAPRASSLGMIREAIAASISGVGTVNQVVAFNDTNTIGDSHISDNGSLVSVSLPVLIGSNLTLANDGISVPVGQTLNIRGTSIAISGNVSGSSYSVVGGGSIAVNGNMNISTSAITTATTDLTLGATSHDVKVLANNFFVNGVKIASVNGKSGILSAAIKQFVIDYPGKPG